MEICDVQHAVSTKECEAVSHVANIGEECKCPECKLVHQEGKVCSQKSSLSQHTMVQFAEQTPDQNDIRPFAYTQQSTSVLRQPAKTGDHGGNMSKSKSEYS